MRSFDSGFVARENSTSRRRRWTMATSAPKDERMKAGPEAPTKQPVLVAGKPEADDRRRQFHVLLEEVGDRHCSHQQQAGKSSRRAGGKRLAAARRHDDGTGLSARSHAPCQSSRIRSGSAEVAARQRPRKPALPPASRRPDERQRHLRTVTQSRTFLCISKDSTRVFGEDGQNIRGDRPVRNGEEVVCRGIERPAARAPPRIRHCRKKASCGPDISPCIYWQSRWNKAMTNGCRDRTLAVGRTSISPKPSCE